jgi:hypothetical protein
MCQVSVDAAEPLIETCESSVLKRAQTFMYTYMMNFYCFGNTVTLSYDSV